MFSEDKESDVTEVKFQFMHPHPNGYWDWPKSKAKQKASGAGDMGDEEDVATDVETVSARYIFLGPCIPSAPTRSGFRFEQDDEAQKKYRVVKNNLKSLLSG